jgi:hypothetical protein
MLQLPLDSVFVVVHLTPTWIFDASGLLLHTMRQSGDVLTTAYYCNAGLAAPRAKLVATHLAVARGTIW